MRFAFLAAAFLTLPLLSAAAEKDGETCLAISAKETSLRDLRSLFSDEPRHHARQSYHAPRENRVSPHGWLIYGGKYKSDPVALVDLETGRKREFLPSVYSAEERSPLAAFEPEPPSLSRPGYKSRLFYGFSESGAFAYALLSDGRLLLKNLPHNEERLFPVEIKGSALAMAFHEEAEALTLLETSQETADKIRKFGRRFISSEKEDRRALVSFAEAARFELQAEDLILRQIDLKSGGETRAIIHRGMKELLCGMISSDRKSLFFVDEAGALYQRPLARLPLLEPVGKPAKNGAIQLFGPVEGFHLGGSPVEIKQRCAFLRGGLNALKAPDGTGYIVRSLKDRLESFMPYEWVHGELEERKRRRPARYTNVFGRVPWPVRPKTAASHFLENLLPHRRIKYPFFREAAGGAWHIPSRRFYPDAGSLGSFYFRVPGPSSGRVSIASGDDYSFIDDFVSRKVMFHPEDGPPRLLFEFKSPNYKSYINADGGLCLLPDSGDIFVIDTSTGAYSRHWAKDNYIAHRGFCETAPDGSLSVLFHKRDSDSQTDFETALRFQRICFKTPPLPPKDIKAVLLDTAAAEAPFSKERLSLFASVLNLEKTARDYPKELTKALWNILKRSPVLYVEIFRRYPALAELDLPADDSLKPEAAEQALSAAREILKKMLQPSLRRRAIADYSLLRPLRPILKMLPDAERDFYIEDITLSLVNSALKTGQDSIHLGIGIPSLLAYPSSSLHPSKLYYLINGRIKELFGLEREPYSDVTVYKNYTNEISEDKTYRIGAALLSSDPIEGHHSAPSSFGFYYSVVKEVSGPLAGLKKGSRLIDETVEWKSHGQSRRARISVNVGIKYGQDVNDLIPALPGPDYESLWRDNRLVGVVAINSTLRDYTRYVADQYLAYFEEQGFELSSHDVIDFKDTVVEWIQNCKADWIMPQGHANGDERNILQIDGRSYIIRAVRHIEKGAGAVSSAAEGGGAEQASRPAYEEVFLVLPRPAKEKEEEAEKTLTDYLSVNELKRAFALRDARGCGQMIYFNTTCWAAHNAVYEMGSVASPSFVNIPTFSLAEIFQSESDSALRALIQSLREGRDFAGFRKALSANKDYRENLRNWYIFPDEEVYRKEIVERIQPPLDIDIDLQEKEGDGKWRRLPAARSEPSS